MIDRRLLRRAYACALAVEVHPDRRADTGAADYRQLVAVIGDWHYQLAVGEGVAAARDEALAAARRLAIDTAVAAGWVDRWERELDALIDFVDDGTALVVAWEPLDRPLLIDLASTALGGDVIPICDGARQVAVAPAVVVDFLARRELGDLERSRPMPAEEALTSAVAAAPFVHDGTPLADAIALGARAST